MFCLLHELFCMWPKKQLKPWRKIIVFNLKIVILQLFFGRCVILFVYTKYFVYYTNYFIYNLREIKPVM